jgi:hypothetical protein
LAEGTIVGIPDTTGTSTAAGVGLTLLVRGAGIGLVLALVVAMVTNAAAVLTELGRHLVPTVLVFGGFFVIYRLLIFGTKRRKSDRRSDRPGSPGKGAVAGLVKVLTAPLRWSVGAGREVPVVRFRLVTVAGETLDCEMLGELTSHLRKGDIVEVYGRRLRDGTIRATRLINKATGEIVRNRVEVAFQLARAANLVAAALFTAGAVVLLYLAVIS